MWIMRNKKPASFLLFENLRLELMTSVCIWSLNGDFCEISYLFNKVFEGKRVGS